jgi:hypothetical protein
LEAGTEKVRGSVWNSSFGCTQIPSAVHTHWFGQSAGILIPRHQCEVSLTIGEPLALGLAQRAPKAELVRATERIVAAIYDLAPRPSEKTREVQGND